MEPYFTEFYPSRPGLWTSKTRGINIVLSTPVRQMTGFAEFTFPSRRVDLWLYGLVAFGGRSHRARVGSRDLALSEQRSC